MKDGFARFTADTGHTLDWQIGFEDPLYNNTFNFLGIGNKRERQKREEKLRELQAEFPAPTSCAMANSIMPKLREHYADAQRRKDEPTVDRELAAFDVIVPQYVNYINKNCIASAAPTVATPPLVPTTSAAVTTPALVSTGTSLASVTDQIKKLPTWVWIAAGGVLLVTTIIIIKK